MTCPYIVTSDEGTAYCILASSGRELADLRDENERMKAALRYVDSASGCPHDKEPGDHVAAIVQERDDLRSFLTELASRLFDIEPTRSPTWNGRANVARYDSLTTSDIRRTSRALFDELDAEFGPLELDVAAQHDNALCERFYAPEDDGLAQPWAPARCWLNPPYSDIEPWTQKAVRERQNGAFVVALLPVRTDLRWFHRDVLGESAATIRFLRGRLRFGASHLENWRTAPFPSMVVVWSPDA